MLDYISRQPVPPLSLPPATLPPITQAPLASSKSLSTPLTPIAKQKQEEKIATPICRPIIHETRLKEDLQRIGLSFSEAEFQNLTSVVTNHFQESNKTGFLYNILKNTLPNFPKMHLFLTCSKTQKKINLYFKGTGQLREGNFKTCLPSYRVVFSTNRAPVVEKVARLKLKEKYVDKYASILEESHKHLAQFKHPLICSNLDFAIYIGKNGKKKVIAYQPLFEKTLSQFEVPTDPSSKNRSLTPIFRKCLEALKLFHEKKLIHNDIKPGNILYNPLTSEIGLADFDFMQTEAADLSTSGTTRSSRGGGTPGYFAPEQFDETLPFGRPSDVWAMGCSFYQLIHAKKFPTWFIITSHISQINRLTLLIKTILQKRNAALSAPEPFPLTGAQTISSSADAIPTCSTDSLQTSIANAMRLKEAVTSQLQTENALFIPPNESEINGIKTQLEDFSKSIIQICRNPSELSHLTSSDLERLKDSLTDIKAKLIVQLRLTWTYLEQNHPRQRPIGDPLKDLIGEMLDPNPRTRITAAAAFSKLPAEENPLPDVLSRVAIPLPSPIPSAENTGTQHLQHFTSPHRGGLKRKGGIEDASPNPSPIKRSLLSLSKSASKDKTQSKQSPGKKEMQSIARKESGKEPRKMRAIPFKIDEVEEGFNPTV